MEKTFSIVIFGILLISVISASMIIPNNENARENAQAPEHSPVISVTDSGQWGLERVDFIHYADGSYKIKSDSYGKPIKQTTCYKLMGVKWNTLPVNYVINPSNPQGLSEGFTTSAISSSAETWDASTSSELFNNAYGINYTAQYGVQNNQNAIVFGNYPQSGVIGVTSIWYTRVGKQIVEFDMILDTDFSWGDASIDATKMDLQNIATHELGHSVGLSDIYSTSCTDVTMYGYSTEGETSKRTLEQSDITGLRAMYGI